MISTTMRRLFVILLAIAEAALPAAADDSPLRDRWVEGHATHDHLWLRDAAGALVEIDRASQERRALASDGVVSMTRSGKQLLVLRLVAGGDGDYEVAEAITGASASPPLQIDGSPLALLADKVPVALTTTALFRLEDGNWQRVALSEELRGGVQNNVASVADGTIYVGVNRGEWGGGMQAVDPRTGTVSEVRRIDGDVCDGPLGQECDPVTGVVRDVSRPDCVLASIGLAHFLAHGRILRVCGETVDVVFNENIPERLLGIEVGRSDDTWPFFGLVATRDGWAAVSQGRMFISSDGVVRSRKAPSFEQWDGLQIASFGDDLIIVVTDVNWGVSLSGETPLLVSVSD